MAFDDNRADPQIIETASRKRIDQLLSEAIHNALVILSAGSGSGKTEAVKSFVSHVREHVVWVHLSPMDSYAERFWNLLAQCISSWSPSLADAMYGESFPGTLAATHSFLEQLVQAARQDGKVIMVFDDFQHMEDGPAKALITNMIEAGGEDISFIIISGEEVDISLSGEIHPIRLTDRHLQFTRDEIRLYYTALGIVLDERRLDTVCRLSEGWAIVVYMLGLHLHRKEPITEQGIDNAVTYLFAMFEQDLFMPFSRDIRQALILLSSLDEFPLELAEDLLDLDGKEMDNIFAHIPFVRFRASTSSYYFHNLYKQYLGTRRSTLPKKVRHAFLRKAAQWYERHGALVEPLTYYLACCDYARAHKVLEGADLLFLRGSAVNIARLLEQVPEDYLESHPMMWVLTSVVYMLSGDARRGVRHMERLHRNLTSGPLTDEGRAALGEYHVAFGFMSMRAGNYDFVRHFKTASELLPNGSSIWTGRTISFVGNSRALPFNGNGPGELLPLRDALFQSAPFMQRLFGSWGRGFEHLAACEVHFYRAEFQQAVPYAGEAISIAVENRQWDIVSCSYYMLVRVALARGMLAEAEYNQKLLRKYAEMVTDRVCLFPDMADFAIFQYLGLQHQAAEWIKADVPPQLDAGMPNVGRELYTKAVYLAMDQQLYAALSYADTAIGICTDNGQWFSRLYLQILKAVCYDMLGQYSIAARHLRTCWELAHDNDIIMPFAEFGGNIRNLIRHTRALPNKATSIPSTWLDQIDAHADQFQKSIATLARDYFQKYPQGEPVSHKLTRREQETLQMLCHGLSNEEIARRLGLEITSVNTSLSRIYHKIGANDRADAVRIGISQGLLSPVGAHP